MEFTPEEKDFLIKILESLDFKIKAVSSILLARGIYDKLTIPPPEPTDQ